MENTKELLIESIYLKKHLSPYIIKCYDTFISDDAHHLILCLELCKKTLKEEFREIRNDSERIRRLFIQCCQGLDYIHKDNNIHRDIKPENILIDFKGNAKIADLNIMRNLDAKYLASEKGSPLFMAPEVSQGHYNQKADVWSLCATFYYLFKKEKGAYFSRDATNTILLAKKKQNSDNYIPLTERDCPDSLIRNIINQTLVLVTKKEFDLRFSPQKMIEIIESNNSSILPGEISEDDRRTQFGRSLRENFDETIDSIEISSVSPRKKDHFRNYSNEGRFGEMIEASYNNKEDIQDTVMMKDSEYINPLVSDTQFFESQEPRNNEYPKVSFLKPKIAQSSDYNENNSEKMNPINLCESNSRYVPQKQYENFLREEKNKKKLLKTQFGNGSEDDDESDEMILASREPNPNLSNSEDSFEEEIPEEIEGNIKKKGEVKKPMKNNYMANSIKRSRAEERDPVESTLSFQFDSMIQNQEYPRKNIPVSHPKESMDSLKYSESGNNIEYGFGKKSNKMRDFEETNLNRSLKKNKKVKNEKRKLDNKNSYGKYDDDFPDEYDEEFEDDFEESFGIKNDDDSFNDSDFDF